MPIVDVTSAEKDGTSAEATPAGSADRISESSSAEDHRSKLRKILQSEPATHDCGAHIGQLKKEQDTLKKQRATLQKELKTAQKRRSRLKSKARQLSNDDLMAVLMMREKEAESKAQDATAALDGASTGAASSASGAAPSTAPHSPTAPRGPTAPLTSTAPPLVKTAPPDRTAESDQESPDE
jgi:hypothetical protein